MKYTVIGWTEYDNDRIETGENDDEAVEAIIADIRANGYCFSGWAHQELHCGAPVLSDQKKRLFSQRSFGALMAVAHGLTADDYPRYAFDYSLKSEKMPSFSQHLFSLDEDTDEDKDEFSVGEEG